MAIKFSNQRFIRVGLDVAKESILRAPCKTVHISSTSLVQSLTEHLTGKSSLPKRVSEKLLNSRANAIAAGHDICLYLGLPNIVDHLVWHQQGSAHILCTAAAVQAHAKAVAAYAASDSNDSCPPPPPEPANLGIIARISSKGTFLAPDGHYGSNSSLYSKPFDKTQLSIQLEPISEHSLLQQDYDTAIATIKKLESLIETSKLSAKSSVVILQVPTPPEQNTKIKIRHNVFRKKSADDDLDDTDLPPECRTENWPTTTPDAQRELKKILSSHIAQPLPVYDPANENRIILPSQYNSKLRDTMCFLRFTLTHYTFSEEKNASGSKLKDVYVADTTPTKRIAAVDPCSPSPEAKRRKSTRN
ncbi:hypothetical protein FKP32DRAFT_1692904 [Trametes sanguinea]|nr:hypothetical protein FKP32DRAFT_1692904 [Trametes sanguinea]